MSGTSTGFALVPSITLDTRGLPEEDQFEAWAAHTSNSRLQPLHDGGFMAHCVLWDLGSIQISWSRLDPFLSDRDKEKRDAVGTNYIQLILLLQGSMTFQSDEADELCEAGDVAVRDYAQSSLVKVLTPIECIVAYCARDFLERSMGASNYQGKLPGNPETEMLVSALRNVTDQLARVPARSAGRYAESLRALMSAALERASGRVSAEDVDRLSRAKRLIAMQPNGSLSTDQLCREMGVSRSVLYRLFEREGGVAAWDRRRRLLLFYRALIDPAEHQSTADLAVRHGFNDRSALHKIFKTAFGLSPSALRERREMGSVRPEDPADQARRMLGQLD